MKSILFTALLAVGAVAVADAGNLLGNDGFESPGIEANTQSDKVPGEWTTFSSVTDKLGIVLTAKKSRNGTQAVRLQTHGIPNSYQGIVQSVGVAGGTNYRFTVFVRNDSDQPLQKSARGQISIEWKNADDQEIDRTWGPDWGSSLNPSGWTKFEMTAKAPANTSRANFVITLHDGGEAVTGAYLVDDADARAMPND